MRTHDGQSVVSRVVAVLETFTVEDGMGVSRVSQLSGIPVSTCHRLLQELAAAGLLERDGTSYRVGLRLWEIAAHAPRSVGVQRLALPFMHDLLEVTQHPVHLAVRDGHEALFVERLAPSGNTLRRPRVGSRYPLHVTAVGRVLLAFADGETQESFLAGPLRRYTRHTEVDPVQLRRTLAEVRTRRFAIADRQVNAEAISVAAPLTDATGQVIAALSVNAPVDQRHERSLAQAVQTAASAISRLAAAPTR